MGVVGWLNLNAFVLDDLDQSDAMFTFAFFDVHRCDYVCDPMIVVRFRIMLMFPSCIIECTSTQNA